MLLLLYLFNPIVTSLRGIQQASELKNVQRKLKCPRTSLGSLSEATRVFDPERLKEIIAELGEQLEPLAQLMRKATTRTGLRTTVNVIKRTYETGRKATDTMKEVIRATVQFAEVLPKWNYTITPQIMH